jgi:acetylserotonin O-methyltransferase
MTEHKSLPGDRDQLVARPREVNGMDNPPDPSTVLDLILAFRKSKTMFAAVKLAVFDALAEGPQSLKQLGAHLQSGEDALERLLDACVGLKLLLYEASLYKNTPVASAYLCRKSPHRMTGYINSSNDAFWRLWECLEFAIKDQENQWTRAFPELKSMPKETYWDYFYKSEESKTEFLMGMHGYGQITSPHVVSAFPLDRFRRLVDLGGGTGHLAIEACKTWPALEAEVYDLEGVVSLTEEILKNAPRHIASRISVTAGDFFEDRLPPGDLYVLARILHDWPEEKVTALLRKISDTIPPETGGLLIAEKLLNGDKSGPEWAQMQNLNMLAIAEGKERTLAQYEELLRAAGFPYIIAQVTTSPLDVIIAFKNRNLADYIELARTVRAIDITPPRNSSLLSFPEQAKWYQVFFEDTRIGCVISNMEGEFVLVNKAYANLHGRSVEETLRLNYKKFTPAKYHDEDARQIAELRANGRVGPFDKEYIRADGKSVPVRVTLELLLVGGHEYIWSIVEEITGAKLVQADPPSPMDLRRNVSR